MKRLNIPKDRTFVGPALIWKRIAAFLIDLAIINLVVLLPFRKLFSSIIPKDYSFSETLSLINNTNYEGLINSVLFSVSILMILYFFMLERKMGQSIGKKIMGIYVASDNSPIKSWQFLVRNLEFIPIFSFIILIFDPLPMFFTSTNQRLTEKLSKTKTVENFSIL